MLGKSFSAAVLVAALALPGMASALTFAGNWQAGANTAGPGLKVALSESSGGFSTPDLAVGGSYSFDLFRIWTPDNSVDAGADLVPRPISVSFGLTAPGAAGGEVTGSTVGLRGPIFGQPQAGELTWDSPLTLAFGQGGTGKLTLALTEGLFNPLLSGLTNNAHFGRDVGATLTYDVAPVPLPAAAWLLLGGMGVLGAASRRKRAA
jgi:hypothetical protein